MDNQIDLEKIAVIFESMAQTRPQAPGVQPPAGGHGTSALVEKLMKLGKPLGQYAGSKMYRGVVTGLNKAFVVSQVTRDQLITEDKRSAEVLKPYLRGRDLGRYMIRPAGLWLIYTHHGIEIKRYPAIEAHLKPYKSRLEQRANKQAWYELQQPQFAYKEWFEGPKIASIRFGLQVGFAYDQSGFYCNDATYFLAPGTKWLTAVLNSSVCNICLISICPSVQNGYSQFFTHKIEQLPIVEPAPADQARLAALVDQLQALAGQGAEVERLECEVDAIVYRTYGLSQEEIAEIERWHAERREQLGAGQRGQRAATDEEADA